MTITSELQIKETIGNLLGNIAPEADLDSLGEDEDIRTTLGIDSFDFLNLLIGLSEAFSIEIPEADYGKLISLKDMISYIQRKLI
ncbi:acyl carrier protein [Pseudanabaena mucicola]|uniref:Acyl carrier protein n=1 Tax=Pseudanabaena mucicola FACHB-723 TaxID=2692860 RepID=A0ABR7ZSH0_9CYAN|nr:phosphopantetheine-binding protein [Pseudanabaena mucicola]MBD2186677.1 acyl carrier protein [Pseudanabaena mucicola FACHB-723]